MESLELINSGLDAVEAIIQYLPKDAVGSDFMNKYVATRDIQKQAADRQKESLNNLIQTSRNMEDSTKEIQSLANSNVENLNDIYNTINSLSESIGKIEEEYRKYADQFQVLIKETEMITSFIGEIQKISSQTNLLSFNASIEAAHAGKAGAGFRIIANEVKKLSENTEKASSNMMTNVQTLFASITALEEETKANSENLTMLTKKAEDTLKSYEAVRSKNNESNRSVESFSYHIANNVTQINDIIENVQKTDDLNSETVSLFTDCASRNSMLFNDLYSFIYEIKSILEDLKKQQM